MSNHLVPPPRMEKSKPESYHELMSENIPRFRDLGFTQQEAMWNVNYIWSSVKGKSDTITISKFDLKRIIQEYIRKRLEYIRNITSQRLKAVCNTSRLYSKVRKISSYNEKGERITIFGEKLDIFKNIHEIINERKNSLQEDLRNNRIQIIKSNTIYYRNISGKQVPYQNTLVVTNCGLGASFINTKYKLKAVYGTSVNFQDSRSIQFGFNNRRDQQAALSTLRSNDFRVRDGLYDDPTSDGILFCSLYESKKFLIEGYRQGDFDLLEDEEVQVYLCEDQYCSNSSAETAGGLLFSSSIFKKSFGYIPYYWTPERESEGRRTLYYSIKNDLDQLVNSVVSINGNTISFKFCGDIGDCKGIQCRLGIKGSFFPSPLSLEHRRTFGKLISSNGVVNYLVRYRNWNLFLYNSKKVIESTKSIEEKKDEISKIQMKYFNPKDRPFMFMGDSDDLCTSYEFIPTMIFLITHLRDFDRKIRFNGPKIMVNNEYYKIEYDNEENSFVWNPSEIPRSFDLIDVDGFKVQVNSKGFFVVQQDCSYVFRFLSTRTLRKQVEEAIPSESGLHVRQTEHNVARYHITGHCMYDKNLKKNSNAREFKRNYKKMNNLKSDEGCIFILSKNFDWLRQNRICYSIIQYLKQVLFLQHASRIDDKNNFAINHHMSVFCLITVLQMSQNVIDSYNLSNEMQNDRNRRGLFCLHYHHSTKISTLSMKKGYGPKSRCETMIEKECLEQKMYLRKRKNNKYHTFIAYDTNKDRKIRNNMKRRDMKKKKLKRPNFNPDVFCGCSFYYYQYFGLNISEILMIGVRSNNQNINKNEEILFYYDVSTNLLFYYPEGKKGNDCFFSGNPFCSCGKIQTIRERRIQINPVGLDQNKCNLFIKSGNEFREMRLKKNKKKEDVFFYPKDPSDLAVVTGNPTYNYENENFDIEKALENRNNRFEKKRKELEENLIEYFDRNDIKILDVNLVFIWKDQNEFT